MITFVTGKGGVGKTRVSLLLAKENPRAILAETTQALKAEAARLSWTPPPIYRFDRQALFEDFLVDTVKIRKIAQWLSELKLFHRLLELSPNLYEILLMQKWCELAETEDLIVDAPATGHFLSLLEAIQTALILFDGGSMRERALRVDEKLKTPGFVEVVLVALPEHSALEELKELDHKIKVFYPGLARECVLNRKHVAPPEGLSLPENLRALAYERPRLEEARTKDFTWSRSLLEGASRW